VPSRVTTGLGPHTISLSRDGKLLAYATLVATSNIWTLPIPERPSTAEGMKRVTDGAQTIEGISVSPDGRWIAYDSNLQGNSDIYRIPVGGGEPVQITRDPADDFNPDWSPDGSEIAFHSFRYGDRDVLAVAADGSGTQDVVRKAGHQRGPRWDPGGERIVFFEEGSGTFVVERTGGRRGAWSPPRMMTSDVEIWPGVHSPDRQWVAYTRRGELWVRRASGGEDRRLFDLSGSPIRDVWGLPVWSADSRTVYFQAWTGRDNAAIWSVPHAGGTPTPLVRFTDPARQFYRPALGSDGRNFYFTIGSRESDIWVMELSKK
jgi:Tol biopolymer transport system component